MSEAIEALAEAWASLDGKLDEFLAGRAGEDTGRLPRLPQRCRRARQATRTPRIRDRARPARHVKKAPPGFANMVKRHSILVNGQTLQIVG
jgi:hypothetical protein